MLLSQTNELEENTETLFQLLEELIRHEMELRLIRQRLEGELQTHRMKQYQMWAESHLTGQDTPPEGERIL